MREAWVSVLSLSGAGAHRGERIGHAIVGVVMHVDADMIAGDVLHNIGHDPLDLLRQRAAIGVAQHHPAGAGLVGRLGAGERVIGIGLVAVEEMLAVDERLAPRGDDGRNRLSDGLQILLEADAERHLDMEVPGLGDETDGRCLRREHRLEARIVRDRAAGPLGHAEGGELGQSKLLRRGEELRVGWSGAGISRLDIVDAEHVELLGDQPFVLEREVDALGLRAVPERGVIEIKALATHRATSQVVTSSPVFGSLASFNSMPMAASSSRIRSASAKFLRLRACVRSAISVEILASLIGGPSKRIAAAEKSWLRSSPRNWQLAFRTSCELAPSAWWIGSVAFESR